VIFTEPVAKNEKSIHPVIRRARIEEEGESES
jgi:hypothetical protein